MLMLHLTYKMLLTKKNMSFLLPFLILEMKLNVDDLTEKQKCPACFGMSMCGDISDINFDWTDFYSIFNNLFGIKNVYYGSFKNSRVILKKLAKKSELDTFDEMKREKHIQNNFSALIRSELNNVDSMDPDVKMRLCPSADKTNNLLKNVRWKDGDGLQHLWTMLKLNPEPIVLEILNRDNNWPTPKYFGACGRLIVEEYIGPPLSAFQAKPWIKRAKIASSLLDAAHLLTFKDEEFAFYPTDISMDNIAVNENDEAIFVDLENIIIVDKNPPNQGLDSWDEIHSNDIDIDCQDCLIFSPSDMCRHKISDHNYYAICKHILDALLQDPPRDIDEGYPSLRSLLKQCSLHSRIDGGIKLKRLLDTIVKNHA